MLTTKPGAIVQHRFILLDGMRGIAAIAVMLFHFTRNTPHPLFGAANLAVDLFFCLSGFVIAFSYQHRLKTEMSLGKFILKRLVRLYPMFIIGSLIGAIALAGKVAHGQSSLAPAGALKAILLNCIYIPYFGNFHVQVGHADYVSTVFPTNDPAWSLFFELAINVAFGIWAIRSTRIRPLLPVAFGALAFVLYAEITGHIDPGWGASNFAGGFPRAIFGIFAGVYIFHAMQAPNFKLPTVHPLILMLLLLVMFSYVPHFEHFKSLLWLGNILIVVPVLVALGSRSHPGGPKMRRVFDYLGWISYPVYCVHYPIYSIFSLMTENASDGLLGVMCCTAITLAVAHFASKFLEEPVRTKLARSLFPA